MNEDLKNELRELLSFDSHWEASLSAMSLQIDMADDESFEELKAAIDLEGSWDDYYKAFVEDWEEEELEVILKGLNKIYDSEETAFDSVVDRVNAYLKRLLDTEVIVH